MKGCVNLSLKLYKLKYISVVLICAFIPGRIFAQSGTAASIGGLQSELDNIYDQMLPLCSSLIGVGQGIAGFAATWYIAYRVWRHIANAEPIDFYPLFRPFVIGFAVQGIKIDGFCVCNMAPDPKSDIPGG